MRSCVMLTLSVAVPALGQPREWSDDFTAAVTYDSASLLAPCYGGPTPRYTVFDGWTGNPFNQHAVSGGGALRITGTVDVFFGEIPPFEVAAIGWLGLNTGCPGEPALGTTTEPFTSPDLCMYSGFSFSPRDLDNLGSFRGGGLPDYPTKGADNLPGVGGVDDDLDGTTDETDEILARRPTTVNGGFGNPGQGAYQAGQDAAPGVAGVDDDGNGTTDDHGEVGWPGTDDGDDEVFPFVYGIMRANVATSSFIYVNIDVSLARFQFGIKEVFAITSIELEENNEISPGFYRPYTHYNYAFCSSGTCYGAVLWVEQDLPNPSETVGPLINTRHNLPSDQACGLTATSGGASFARQRTHRVNQSFSHTFWVISGNTASFYPSASADLDGDRDVDGTDFLTFSNCFNGALNPPGPACPSAAARLNADLDGDNDVDGTDFLTFSNCFNGALNRPAALCMPPNLTSCP